MVICWDRTMASLLDSGCEEWEELDKEFTPLEKQHREYVRKVEEVKAAQKKCIQGIAHQRYRMKAILDTCKSLPAEQSEENAAKLKGLQDHISQRKIIFREMEDVLPHESGKNISDKLGRLYLKVILGSVNISLLSKHDKYNYKEDYEGFKLGVTVTTMALAILLLFIDYRVTDAAFQFLLVWYYCTLTIREHILKMNGSRIKGWWITHHFLSTFCSAIMLIWPDGSTYHQFRLQFVVFSAYITLVNILQYFYQKGCLYRLRALGERHNMDITAEGFQTWMWQGLTFILPFLIAAYIFQIYNALVLFQLSLQPECIEWQVPVLSGVFFILFLGNSSTTAGVIRNKIKKDGWMKKIEQTLHFRNHRVNKKQI